jgi:pimeloyl-ACP methyl ester carboxylesterase
MQIEVARDPLAPTVVMVHGAWVDGTGWREVIALLQIKGLKVIAVQNPLSSLADDADAATRAINRQSNSVVLVGHCYGGTVITQTGNNEKVAALVYVAAFAPDVGQSTNDTQKGYPMPHCVASLEIDAGGYLYIAQDSVTKFLAQDLPAADSFILAAAQKPIRASALTDRVAAAAWHEKPCWYLVTDDDRAIAPDLQREFAKKINATIVTVQSGHVPFLSKPRETAEVILAAVDAVNCRRRKAAR